MRFADGPEVKVDVYVDASPATVWAYVQDIDLPCRFSTEFQGGSWIDDTGPALGAKFLGRNRHPAIGEWTTTSFVTAYEPERIFGWAVSDPDTPSASWRFELVPEGGGTRLKQWVRMGPGPSGLSVAIEQMPDKEERIIARRQQEHRENMTRTLEGIKELAENAAP